MSYKRKNFYSGTQGLYRKAVLPIALLCDILKSSRVV
jgi:hypothetical protein